MLMPYIELVNQSPILWLPNLKLVVIIKSWFSFPKYLETRFLLPKPEVNCQVDIYPNN